MTLLLPLFAVALLSVAVCEDSNTESTVFVFSDTGAVDLEEIVEAKVTFVFRTTDAYPRPDGGCAVLQHKNRCTLPPNVDAQGWTTQSLAVDHGHNEFFFCYVRWPHVLKNDSNGHTVYDPPNCAGDLERDERCQHCTIVQLFRVPFTWGMGFKMPHAPQEEAELVSSGVDIDTVRQNYVRFYFREQEQFRGCGRSMERFLAILWTLDPSRTGKVFIDVGANTGKWTEEVVSLWVRPHLKEFDAMHTLPEICPDNDKDDGFAVHALEPLEKNFKILSQRKSHFGWDNVYLHHLAASDEIGQAHLFHQPLERAKSDEWASLIPPSEHYWEFARTASTVIETITIDDMLDGEGIKDVFLVKIDTEGFDIHVIDGMAKSLLDGRIPLFIFEGTYWSKPGANVKSVVHRLHEAGFDVFALGEKDMLPLHPPYWHDNYDVYPHIWTNYVAISKAHYLKYALLESFNRNVKYFDIPAE